MKSFKSIALATAIAATTAFAADASAAEADGRNTTVILVHGAFAESASWNGVVPRLTARGYTVVAAGNPLRSVAGDAEVVDGLVERAPGPVVLVGHSYGGALALWAARTLGKHVSHLALYEPMLPGLLRPHGRLEAAAEAEALHADVQRLGAAGDWLALGERFSDYFNGDGSWAASPPARRAAIAAALPPNVAEWAPVMAPLPADAFAGIGARCLLLRGTHTRRALREIAAVLARQHAHWQLDELPGCGHMGPLTHAEQVNQRLVEFLDEAPVVAAA